MTNLRSEFHHLERAGSGLFETLFQSISDVLYQELRTLYSNPKSEREILSLSSLGALGVFSARRCAKAVQCQSNSPNFITALASSDNRNVVSSVSASELI